MAAVLATGTCTQRIFKTGTSACKCNNINLLLLHKILHFHQQLLVYIYQMWSGTFTQKFFTIRSMVLIDSYVCNFPTLIRCFYTNIFRISSLIRIVISNQIFRGFFTFVEILSYKINLNDIQIWKNLIVSQDFSSALTF